MATLSELVMNYAIAEYDVEYYQKRVDNKNDFKYTRAHTAYKANPDDKALEKAFNEQVVILGQYNTHLTNAKNAYRLTRAKLPDVYPDTLSPKTVEAAALLAKIHDEVREGAASKTAPRLPGGEKNTYIKNMVFTRGSVQYLAYANKVKAAPAAGVVAQTETVNEDSRPIATTLKKQIEEYAYMKYRIFYAKQKQVQLQSELSAVQAKINNLPGDITPQLHSLTDAQKKIRDSITAMAKLEAAASKDLQTTAPKFNFPVSDYKGPFFAGLDTNLKNSLANSKQSIDPNNPGARAAVVNIFSGYGKTIAEQEASRKRYADYLADVARTGNTGDHVQKMGSQIFSPAVNDLLYKQKNADAEAKKNAAILAGQGALNPETQARTLEAKKKAERDAALAKQKQTGTTVPLPPGSPAASSDNTTQQVKQAKFGVELDNEANPKAIPTAGPDANKGRGLTDDISLAGNSTEAEAEIIENPLAIVGEDPLAQQFAGQGIDNPTQLYVEDIMDARHYQLIMPYSFDDDTPAYITLKNDSFATPSFRDTDVVSVENVIKGPNFKNPFGSDYGARYNQFSVTHLDESYNEKFQVVDSLAEGQVVFSFGKKAEFWTIRGTLINDVYSNWLAKMREAWENYLRLSKLVELGKYARFVIPEIRLAFNCYPVALTINNSTDRSPLPSWAMMVFVREWHIMPKIPFQINSAAAAMINNMLAMDGLQFLPENAGSGVQSVTVPAIPATAEGELGKAKTAAANFFGIPVDVGGAASSAANFFGIPTDIVSDPIAKLQGAASNTLGSLNLPFDLGQRFSNDNELGKELNESDKVMAGLAEKGYVKFVDGEWVYTGTA